MSVGEIAPKVRASTLLTGNSTGTNIIVGPPVFSGGANVTLSGTGNTIAISAAAQTVQTEGWSAIGNTTGSTSSTSFNSNFSISGSGGASVGLSGQTILIAAPATSALSWVAVGNTTGSTSSTTFQNAFSISGASGDSVGFSGNTIIVSGGGGGGGATLSKTYFPADGNVVTASFALATNVMFIQYCPVNQNLSISRAGIIISVLPQTSAAASSGSWSATIGMGLYTRNGTSYSSYFTSTASVSTGWTSNTNSNLVTGARLLTIPFATTMAPNEYWMMVNVSTATGANLSASQSIWYGGAGGAQLFPQMTLGGFGNAAAIAGEPILGVGTVATASYTLPASLGMLTVSNGLNNGNIFIQLDNYSVTS